MKTYHRWIIGGAVMLSVAFASGAAQAEHLAGNCLFKATKPDGTVVTIMDGALLDKAISDTPVRKLNLPGGYSQAFAVCERPLLRLDANDYRVLRLGYVLYINAPDSRRMVLEVSDGQLSVRLLDNTSPTQDDMTDTQKMINALQTAYQDDYQASLRK